MRVITRIFIFILFVFLIGCAGVPTVKTDIQNKTNFNINSKIAILPSSTMMMNSLLPDALTTAFLGLGFNIIERNELVRLLSEQKLSLTGILESSDYYKLGNIANIDNIIIVNSKEMMDGSVAQAVVKIIAIQSGKVIASSTYFQPRPNTNDYIYYDNVSETAKKIAKSIHDKLINNK